LCYSLVYIRTSIHNQKIYKMKTTKEILDKLGNRIKFINGGNDLKISRPTQDYLFITSKSVIFENPENECSGAIEVNEWRMKIHIYPTFIRISRCVHSYKNYEKSIRWTKTAPIEGVKILY